MILRNVTVIGNGWAALTTLGFLSKHPNINLRWVAGTGSRVIPPLPTLTSQRSADVLITLCNALSIEIGGLQTGAFVREFKNKAFREPAWLRGQNPEEILWAPETRFVGPEEYRFSLCLNECEALVREKLQELTNVKKVEGLLVSALQQEDSLLKVVLDSGEEISSDIVIFADRWSCLHTIKGLPKPLVFNRNRNPVGVLQATFQHLVPITELSDGLFGACQREAGEEFQRNIWGYFYDGGKKSVWSLYLSEDEVEDNHEITKKLRRMKQTLDKMFSNPEWLPADFSADFISTVISEHVRFEEASVLAAGVTPKEPITLQKTRQFENLYFLTDGYGPTAAIEQASLMTEKVIN